jgi:hypothetical protein
MFSNVTLRGTIVGYAVQFRCPLFDGNGCDIDGSTFESQDLHSGKVIRSIAVGGGGITASNGFDGPVVSATGGLAWIEHEAYSPYGTVVLRSDSPVTDPRAAIEPDRLDEGPAGTIDPDSLGFDGTDMTWRRDGVLKRAPLR